LGSILPNKFPSDFRAPEGHPKMVEDRFGRRKFSPKMKSSTKGLDSFDQMVNLFSWFEDRKRRTIKIVG